MPELAIPDPPKVESNGCYNLKEVINFVDIVGEQQAAKMLNVPLHRIAFFVTKLMEPKRVNTRIHSFR